MRFLPARMRRPVSIAYLLARASDTLADVDGVEAEEKLQALALFREKSIDQLSELVERGYKGRVPIAKEAMLLSQIGALWEMSEKLEPSCRVAVAEVVDTITSGQMGDVQRFEIEGEAMVSEQDLLHYCYQVAGCVGEFWSEVGVHTQPHFSNVSLEQLRQWGKAFGQGLQLVNIIRDAPSDLEQGRVYIPGMQVLSGEKVEPWITLAREGAAAGIRYSDSLGGRVQRMATYLPASLALETLDLVEEASVSQWSSGVKVPRRKVYREMFSGLLRAQKF